MTENWGSSPRPRIAVYAILDGDEALVAGYRQNLETVLRAGGA